MKKHRTIGFPVGNPGQLLNHLNVLFKNKELSIDSIRSVITNGGVHVCYACASEFGKETISKLGEITHKIGDHELIKDYIGINDSYLSIQGINDAMYDFRTLNGVYGGYYEGYDDLYNRRKCMIDMITRISSDAILYIEKKLFTVLKFDIKNEYVQLLILFLMIDCSIKTNLILFTKFDY